MAGNVYVATESVSGLLFDGEPIDLRRGVTRVREGHPLLEAHPGYFRELDVHFDVEDATARPGQQRNVPPADPPKPESDEKPKPRKRASRRTVGAGGQGGSAADEE